MPVPVVMSVRLMPVIVVVVIVVMIVVVIVIVIMVIVDVIRAGLMQMIVIVRHERPYP